MPISSLLVKAQSKDVERIAGAIGAMPGAQVFRVAGEDIAVLTETTDRDEDKGIWDAVEALPGVVKIDLIYTNFEDLEE
jgi:nitrate reductase NapAB chaperone NapD